MIKLKHNAEAHGYEITSIAPSDPMDRERHLGFVQIHTTGFAASIQGGSITISRNSQSLPASIQTLIDFHKLTDYQYAPWPIMEEDEE